MEHITISGPSASGFYRANLEHDGIKLSCPNGASATEVTDTARNTIRLLKEAVDLGWFSHTKKKTTEIGVIGTAHSTTVIDGHKVKDPKHITVTVIPIREGRHLYLLPNEENETVDEHTRLDTERPPEH